jgi:hypothetical protein
MSHVTCQTHLPESTGTQLMLSLEGCDSEAHLKMVVHFRFPMTLASPNSAIFLCF